MNKEINKLDIKKTADKWDAKGAVIVYHEGKRIYKDFFGYASHETGERINEDSTYLFSGSSRFLLALSTLMLSDMKKLNINDTIDKYIPEYANAHKIKIKHLLAGESGLRDYFYGKIMLELKDKHSSLDGKERVIEENKMSTRTYSFEKVLELIGSDELECEPGTLDAGFSETENIFLKEIIERVSGMKLLDFQFKYIFEALNMSKVKRGREVNTNTYNYFRDKELILSRIDEESADLCTITASDAEKMMIAIYEGIVLSDNKLLSENVWKKALKFNAENAGFGFNSVNGIICNGEFGILGNSITMYFYKEAKLCYVHLTNAGLKIENIDGSWMHFRRELRNEIDSFFTYPRNTRIEPYNKKNWYDVLNLEISKEQYEFVCDAKQSIAYAFAFKEDHKLFVEMEGDKPVGLMVLKANKKKKDYHFAILLVDKRFQGRGFGKIMLKWALDYFRKQGATELTIGVNRFNISAVKLYKSLGFKEDIVYEEGMQLKITL